MFHMNLAETLGNQHLNLLPGQFGWIVTKQHLGGVVGLQDQAFAVNRYQTFNRCLRKAWIKVSQQRHESWKLGMEWRRQTANVSHALPNRSSTTVFEAQQLRSNYRPFRPSDPLLYSRPQGHFIFTYALDPDPRHSLCVTG